MMVRLLNVNHTSQYGLMDTHAFSGAKQLEINARSNSFAHFTSMQIIHFMLSLPNCMGSVWLLIIQKSRLCILLHQFPELQVAMKWSCDCDCLVQCRWSQNCANFSERVVSSFELACERAGLWDSDSVVIDSVLQTGLTPVYMQQWYLRPEMYQQIMSQYSVEMKHNVTVLAGLLESFLWIFWLVFKNLQLVGKGRRRTLVTQTNRRSQNICSSCRDQASSYIQTSNCSNRTSPYHGNSPYRAKPWRKQNLFWNPLMHDAKALTCGSSGIGESPSLRASGLRKQNSTQPCW